MFDLRHAWASAWQGQPEAMQQIVEKLDPLLQKYARKLSGEDGKSDLVLFVLTLIKATDPAKFAGDGQLVAYLHKSVVHEYIRLSRKRWRITQAEQLQGDEAPEQACPDFAPQCDNTLLLRHCLQKLSAKERSLIYQHYILDQSISDIAATSGISRQAVNQLKCRAIRKISKEMLDGA